MLMNRCFPWVSFAYVKDMPIWVVIWGLITEWLFHKKGLIILVPGNEALRLEKQITCENWGFFTVYRCLSSFLFKSLYKSHLLVARSYVALSTIWVHFPRSNTSMRLNKTMNAWMLLSRFKILSRIFIFLLQTPFRWTKHNIIEYISLFKPFI